MDHELERRAEDIFQQTLDAPTADRPAVAAKACGGDAALLALVHSLLDAAAVDDRFLSDPTADAAATAGAMPLPPTFAVGEKPGDRVGRYKLLQQIGEGGFGVVFLAEQEVPVRRQVAVKVIKLGMDTKEVVARFEAERQALAMMDHPNIARVLDAGATDTGRPYFVMELVRGSPITEYADKKKLSTADRVALAAQVCRAVQHAHGKGIIHRDLKPSNVLVTVTDDKPVPKVIDFGIAKATQSRLTDRTLFTQFRQLIGTPQYMSPEQADNDGADIDTRSDVYSLGVLLYELLVGTTPLDARQLRSAAFEAMRRMIRDVEPPKPSTRLSALGQTQAAVAANRGTDAKHLGRQLHGELDWIVMRALEKDRTRRYDTAAALADDLGRYLAGDAVLAGPVSGAYRLKKLARRYRAAIAVASVVAALLVLGVAGTTFGLVRESRQRRVADAERRLADAQRAEAVAQQTAAQAARGQAERAEGDAERQARLAKAAQGQAEQARGDAERQATAANRVAARSEARYLIGEGLLPAAYTRAIDAWNLGQKWEDGFTLDRIRAAAQRHWRVVARVPVDDDDDDAASVACFVRTATGGTVLVVGVGRDLTTYDADTGRPLARAVLPSPAWKLLANDAPLDSVTVIRKSDVDRYAIRGLQQVASRPIAVLKRTIIPTYDVVANAKELVFVDDGGTVRVLNLTDLTETDKLDEAEAVPWKIEGGRIFRPDRIAISPSGNRILLGWRGNEAGTLWERGPGRAREITHPSLHDPAFLNVFSFADDAVLVTERDDLQHGGAVHVSGYDLSARPPSGSDPSPVFDAQVSTGASVKNFQVRPAPGGHGGYRIAGFGYYGVLMLTTQAQQAAEFDQYANLLPTDGGRLRLLALSVESGLLALRQSDGIAICRREPDDESLTQHAVERFCGCRDGVLSIRDLHGAELMLSLQPFDAAKPSRMFALQWAAGTTDRSQPYPTAVCATPDGSTVVVCGAETSALMSADRLRPYAIRAFVYRNAGGLARADQAWHLDHVSELHGAGGPFEMVRDAGTTAIDPTGQVLLYAVTHGDQRFSLATGQPLGAIPLGNIHHLSDDGSLVASVNAGEGTLNVFDVATGRRVTSVPGHTSAATVCLSADDRRVVVGDGTTVQAYAVPDGRPDWTVPSALHPLAVPAGDPVERFVAYQPDGGESTSGNLVMADPAGHIGAILIRAPYSAPPVWFSPDGRAVVITSPALEVFRSLTPDQLTAALHDRQVTAEPATDGVAMSPVQLPPPTGLDVLDATDTKALATRVETEVAVRGTVASVSRPMGDKGMAFMDFEGAGPTAFECYFPADAVQALEKKHGVGYVDGLTGRQVEVRGTLIRYVSPTSGVARLEVKISSSAELIVRPGPATHPVAASVPNPANVLDATDAKALAADIGTTVTVRGTVTRVGWGRGRAVAFLNMTPADEQGFTAFVPGKAVGQFEAKSGNGFLDGLKGRTVEVRGKLILHASPTTGQKTLEVVVNDPAALRVLPAKP